MLHHSSVSLTVPHTFSVLQIKPENSGKALESIETGGTVPASGASSGPQDKNSRERKMSGSSNATMKNKWMKALRGITQTPTVTSKEPER